MERYWLGFAGLLIPISAVDPQLSEAVAGYVADGHGLERLGFAADISSLLHSYVAGLLCSEIVPPRCPKGCISVECGEADGEKSVASKS